VLVGASGVCAWVLVCVRGCVGACVRACVRACRAWSCVRVCVRACVHGMRYNAYDMVHWVLVCVRSAWQYSMYYVKSGVGLAMAV